VLRLLHDLEPGECLSFETARLQHIPALTGSFPSADDLTTVLTALDLPDLFLDGIIRKGNPLALQQLIDSMGEPPLLAADLFRSADAHTPAVDHTVDDSLDEQNGNASEVCLLRHLKTLT